MAQQVTASAVKSHYLSSIPGTQTWEGETRIPYIAP